MKHPLRLGVSLDQGDQRRAAVRRARGSGSSRRRSETIRRSLRIRAPCWRSWPGRPAASPRVHCRNIRRTCRRPLLAQHLGNSQHQVGGRCPFGQGTRQLEADDLRDQHRHRLTQHGRLGLDAPHAPAEHAQAVDHRRVRVGADQRVGIGQSRLAIRLLGREDDPGQILEIHLVDDPRVRRNHPEIIERVLAPAEKRVSFAVTLKFQFGVGRERVSCSRLVHLHRVVDHQLDRLERIDLSWGLPPTVSSRRASPPDRRSPAHP